MRPATPRPLAVAVCFLALLTLINIWESPAAVLTPTLLSQAYGTAVEVAQNPLTGHLDIFTPASTRKRQPESALRLLLENIPEGAK